MLRLAAYVNPSASHSAENQSSPADILEAVASPVLSHYRSELVERVRPTATSWPQGSHRQAGEGIRLLLRRERAIDLAYRRNIFRRPSPLFARESFIKSRGKRPDSQHGIQIISPSRRRRNDAVDRATCDDSAFGTESAPEAARRKRLRAGGHTCGDVRAWETRAAIFKGKRDQHHPRKASMRRRRRKLRRQRRTAAA